MNEHITHPIERMIERTQSALERIRSLEIDLSQFSINCIGNLSLHSHSTKFSKVKETLHTLRSAGADMTLVNYFMNQGELCLCYVSRHLGCDVFFNATDTDEALRAVSGGRCSIQTIQREPEQEVVCNPTPHTN